MPIVTGNADSFLACVSVGRRVRAPHEESTGQSGPVRALVAASLPGGEP